MQVRVGGFGMRRRTTVSMGLMVKGGMFPQGNEDRG